MTCRRRSSEPAHDDDEWEYEEDEPAVAYPAAIFRPPSPVAELTCLDESDRL